MDPSSSAPHSGDKRRRLANVDANRGDRTGASDDHDAGGGGGGGAFGGNRPPRIVPGPGTTMRRELNRAQMDAAWAALDHADARMCLNAIRFGAIPNRPLVAWRGTTRLELTSEFAAYLRVYMLQFDNDAFDAIQAFGVVPIAFKRLPNGDVAGYVPRYPGWTVAVHLERGRPIYDFFWLADTYGAGAGGVGALHASYNAADEGAWGPVGGRYDADVYVVGGFGADPDADGTLRSNLAAAADVIAFARELLESASTAEHTLALPPVVLERDTSIDRQAAETHKHGYYQGSVDVAAAKYDEELRFERSDDDIERLRHGFAEYERVTGHRHPADTFAREDARNRYRTAGPADDAPRRRPLGSRQLVLPSTRRLVAAQLPVRNAALVEQLEYVQYTICGLLNVPRAMLACESSVRAGAEASSEAFARTVHMWSERLEALMTLVYEHAFGKRDFRTELRWRVTQRERRRYANGVDFGERAREPPPPLADDADFFAADAATRVTIAFDKTPAVPGAELDYARNRGLIGWQPYRDRRLAQLGIPRELGESKDPLSADERLALVAGGKSPTDSAAAAAKSSKSKSSSGAKKARKD